MWKTVIIFSTFVVVSFCQNNNYNTSLHKRKPYYDPYYHHLFVYGGGLLYYVGFILIKIKVVFVLGAIFAISMVIGKFFALIKYAEYMNKPDHHHQPEKIHLQSHDHGPALHSGPPPSYSSPYASPYSGGITVDKLPPDAEIAGGKYYDSPPPHGFGRNHNDDVNLDNYYNLFREMIRKMNLTEVAFTTIKLKSTECRKKFVCKVDYSAKYSTILSASLKLFRDEHYNKYKTNRTVSSVADCDRLYQNCKNTNI